MIHLAQCVEEAWQRTVEEISTTSGKVDEIARITANVPLAEEMGQLALDMLERALNGDFEDFEPWPRDSQGQYQRELEGVTLSYDPHTHQLTVETHLSELVTVEARGTAEASGFTIGEVAVEAVGRYYSDGWGGRTRERALTEAQAEAERKLSKAVEALHEQQNAPALAEAEAEALAQAEAEAKKELARRQQEVRAALHEQLKITLAQAEERVYHEINRAVGEAYRQTLHQLVLDNGGRVLVDEQTGSVINMELELY
jgi:Skp family chaperone for outer membrane proteins